MYIGYKVLVGLVACSKGDCVTRWMVGVPCMYLDGEDGCSLEGTVLGLTMVLEFGLTVVVELGLTAVVELGLTVVEELGLAVVVEAL